MRILRAVVALPVVLGSLSLVACGSGGTSTGNTGDASTGGDAGGGQDGGGTGDGSTSDSSTHADGGTSACSSPAGCTSATPICCGTIAITGGTVPNCTTDPPAIKCATSADCPTTLGTSCSGTQVVRLCVATADCTESGSDKCCTFTQDGGSLSFCSNAFVAGVAGGKCK